MVSGNPLNPSYISSNGGLSTSTYYNSLRPDITGAEISLPKSDRTVMRFFNTAAFTIPAGQFGTAGRDCITGPGQINLDLNVRKSFALDDKNRRVNIDLASAEPAQSPQLGSVSTNINSQNYGQVLNMRPMRSMTMNLGVNF